MITRLTYTLSVAVIWKKNSKGCITTTIHTEMSEICTLKTRIIQAAKGPPVELKGSTENAMYLLMLYLLNTKHVHRLTAPSITVLLYYFLLTEMLLL